MPGMDGFAVLEALRAIEAERYVPVLVITAQPGHKLRALQAGAKDFISKPIDLVEAKARIHNMLEVRLLYRQIANHNLVLEQTVAERTAELRVSEERFHRLTELSSDWYWEQDANGTIHRTLRARRWRCSAFAVTVARGQRSRRCRATLEGTGARKSRCQYRRPAALPGSDLQQNQRRRQRTVLSGERGAHLQSIRSVYGLPRHRHGRD